VLQAEVEVGESLPVPTGAYDRARDQYRSEVILDGPRRHEISGDRILSLVDLDCYAGELNFIFGQATVGGRQALVALPRLKPSFYARPMEVERFRKRVLKEAVHELAHTWGLGHCPREHCVMHFSNRLEDTDKKEDHLCDRCASLWADAVREENEIG
jgi:archaemetzincin